MNNTNSTRYIYLLFTSFSLFLLLLTPAFAEEGEGPDLGGGDNCTTREINGVTFECCRHSFRDNITCTEENYVWEDDPCGDFPDRRTVTTIDYTAARCTGEDCTKNITINNRDKYIETIQLYCRGRRNPFAAPPRWERVCSSITHIEHLCDWEPLECPLCDGHVVTKNKPKVERVEDSYNDCDDPSLTLSPEEQVEIAEQLEGENLALIYQPEDSIWSAYSKDGIDPPSNELKCEKGDELEAEEEDAKGTSNL